METSPVQIREVRSSDVPAVVELVRNILAEFGLRFGEGSDTDQAVIHLPESYVRKGGAFWIATDSSDVIIGTCGVFPLDSTTFELRKMYLLSSARGRGVARLFLDACVSFVRARGGKRLVLDTTDQMKRAIAFYERNGFVRDDFWIRGARCSRGYVREL